MQILTLIQSDHGPVSTMVIFALNNALLFGLMGMVDVLALCGLNFVQAKRNSTVKWKPKVIIAIVRTCIRWKNQ